MGNAIFISYAQQDRDRVDEILHTLSVRSVLPEVTDETTDLLRDLKPGSSIRNIIRQRIESASTVILIWTQAAAQSQWVNYEAGMADALGKKIIVVLPSKSAPTIPENLREAQIVTLSEDV